MSKLNTAKLRMKTIHAIGVFKPFVFFEHFRKSEQNLTVYMKIDNTHYASLDTGAVYQLSSLHSYVMEVEIEQVGIRNE